MLFGCLAFIRGAPVIHPSLRRKLEGQRSLVAYLDAIADGYFAAGVPAMADDASVHWSHWDAASGKAGERCVCGGGCACRRGRGMPCSLSCCARRASLFSCAMPVCTYSELHEHLHERSAPGVLYAAHRYSKQKTAKEAELQRKGKIWLACAAAAIAGALPASQGTCLFVPAAAPRRRLSNATLSGPRT